MQTRENYRANTTKISIKLEREGREGEIERDGRWNGKAISPSFPPSYRVNESHVFHFIPIVSSRYTFAIYMFVFCYTGKKFPLSPFEISFGITYKLQRNNAVDVLFPSFSDEINRGDEKIGKQCLVTQPRGNGFTFTSLKYCIIFF